MNTHNSSNTFQNQTMNNTQTRTYSNVIKTNNDNFPSRNLAIVVHNFENLTTKDYIQAISKIVGPKNIIFYSKISNKRICLYLSTKDLVEKVIQQHSTITIKDFQVEIRRLINPAKRLVISNVCPSIPHNIIEEELKRNHVKLVSPMSFLRLGIPDPEFSHIFSFRRHIFINENSEQPVPTSLEIEHENTKYRIFLTTDTTCFSCRQIGHTANMCPNKPENLSQENQTTNTQIENEIVNQPTENMIVNQPVENVKSVENNPKNNPKRQAPSSSSIDENMIERVETIEDTEPESENSMSTQKSTKGKRKQKMKKHKRSESLESISSLEIRENLQPIKKLMQANKKYNVTYEQLVDFMENVSGSADPLSIARDYTTNITGFISTLRDIHSKLKNATIKSRITRVSNKIKTQLTQELENVSNTDEPEEQAAEST